MRRLINKGIVQLILAMLSSYAFGQAYPNWIGTGNWSSGSNWNTGSFGYGQIEFQGSGGTSSNNDINPASQWRIFFNNGVGYTITGSPIHLFDFGGNPSWLLSQSTALQTINPLISFRDNSGGSRQAWITTRNSGGFQFGNVELAGNTTLLRIAGQNTNGRITVGGVLSSALSIPVIIGRDETNAAQPNTRVTVNGSNTYVGNTEVDAGELWIGTGNINNGTVSVGNTTASTETAKLWLSNVAGGTTFARPITINQGNASTREIGGLNTSGTHTFSGTITNNSTNGLLVTALNAGGTLNISGVISVANPVTFNGAGTIVLSGDNTFNAQATVNSGISVKQGSANRALGSVATGSTVLSGGTFDVNGFSVTNNEPITLNGIGVGGIGALTNNPSVNSNATWGGSITLGSNSTISATNGDLSLTSTTNLTGTGFALTLAGNSNGSLAAAIQTGAAGTLVKNGNGTWTLSGASTYGGVGGSPTTINAGTLRINGGNNRLPTATALSIASGATFDLNGQNQQVGSLSSITSGGTVTLGTGTFGVGGTASTTFSGNISGSGSFIKQGSGALTLSGTNTYTGATTINAGDLILNSATALPNASNVSLAGGRMVLANTIPAANFTPGTLTLGGTTNSEIDLGTSANAVTITFANSSAAGWTAGRRITIRNWTPSGNKNIFFAGSGLTAAQLDVIDFDGYGLGAKFDGATNRIIPRFIYVTQASGSGNFSAPASWLNNDNPNGTSCASNPATIVIQSGFTLTQDIDYDLTRIENSGTYLSNAVTITLCSGGSFVNNGTVNFTTGGGGTLFCSGTTTFSGTAPSTSFGLNNLTLNGTTTFTSAPTIGGNLQLNAGSSVSAAPVYGNNSTLIYNTGGTYGVNQEWTGNATTAGTGIPQNVTLQNNTTLNFPTTNRGCAGDFLISSGNAQLNVASGDLYVAGNFTNNGTFTHNNRALFMVGGNAQSLSGTLNATGANNCLPFLLINKTGNTVTLNATVNVTNTLTLSNGTITLGSNNLQITSGNDVAGTGFGAGKMIIADGSGQLIFTTATNKTYVYPIGDNTSGADYSPITINLTAGAAGGASLGMRVVDAAVPATPLNTPFSPADYLTRYWVPTATGFSTIGWNGSLSYAATGDVVGTAGNLRFSVWHPAPENSWMDYGGGPTGTNLTGGTTISDLNALSSSAFITGRVAAPKLYYRTTATGNWSNTGIWETSLVADFSGGVSGAIVSPSAFNSNGISIRTGHTVTIVAEATLDQTVIAGGGILVKANGNLGISDGAGIDLEILNGGIFRHATTVGNTAQFATGSTVWVRTGGMVEITQAAGGPSVYGTAANMNYETDAVFNFNVNSPLVTSSTTYFPNAGAAIIPIFRLSSSISLPVGAGTGNNTIINGLFEANGNITWQNGGTKIFRNGIIGTGTVTQSPDCGPFVINGNTSVLGGTGALALHSAGLQLTAGSCTLLSNKSINATGVAGTFTVQNNATLNAQGFSLSGSGLFTLNNGGTLITSHANGVNGSIMVSGATDFQNGSNYTFNGSVNQTTGTLMTGIVGTLTINNSGAAPNNLVTLSNNNTQATTLNLQAGTFRCGTGQTLIIPDGGIINGTGGNQDDNVASGNIHFHGGGTINATLTGQPQLYSVIVGNGVVNTGVNMAGSGPSNPTILNRLQLNSQGFLTNAPFYTTNSTLVYNSGGTYDKRVEMGQTTAGQPGYPWHVNVQNGTTLNLLPANVTSDQSMSGDLTIGVDGLGNGSIVGNNVVHDLVVGGNLFIGGTSATGALSLSSIFGADLRLTGNYTRTTNGTFNPNNRAVFLVGAGSVSINAPTPGPEVFPFVIVDKEGGQSTSVTLNRSVNISGKLTLSSGRVISTLANLLNISNGAADDAANGVGYTLGDPAYVDGPLRRNIGTTSGDYQFPIGRLISSTHYQKGIILRPTANAGNSFTATYERTSPPQAGSDFFTDDLLGINNIEYWQLDKLNASPAIETRVLLPYSNPNNWRDEAGGSITPCASCNVAVVERSADAGSGTWSFANGVAGLFSSTYSPPEYRFYNDAGFIASKPISTFSPFTIGFSFNIILPLQVLKFDAVLVSNNLAKLTWEIDDPADLHYNTVEHSTDGIKFAEIATILPAGNNYTFYHPDLSAGSHYYRIKLKEKNGEIHRTPTKRLTVSGNAAQILTAAPNPLSHGKPLTVSLWLANNEQAQLALFDAAGRKIWQQQLAGFGSMQQRSIPAQLLASGTYRLVLLSNSQVRDTKTILVQ